MPQLSSSPNAHTSASQPAWSASMRRRPCTRAYPREKQPPGSFSMPARTSEAAEMSAAEMSDGSAQIARRVDAESSRTTTLQQRNCSAVKRSSDGASVGQAQSVVAWSLEAPEAPTDSRVVDRTGGHEALERDRTSVVDERWLSVEVRRACELRPGPGVVVISVRRVHAQVLRADSAPHRLRYGQVRTARGCAALRPRAENAQRPETRGATLVLRTLLSAR
eukprot:CAMPEP_0119431904 /NCGR_PEP_ID=MMETSP1335-20130426/46792_1 /TAXON_ID=259385 /ORGANISM="Chrysoculter rhomboideus, Strain RCC1486" /LENGTH=220 /DNA_ID=CAMNT_0007457711 /DNA_START=97 /DNA_END=761 /DNA_ORIENTATION=-